ncbi:hypothetical protein [Clostridium merdae]|uniref:hypothetical protein n=1 Tax=Clostridium merdae TaxID=1958780 RepID=UPI0013566A73|nr:hypothetical protein [Clostridium merdae]
MRKSIIFFIVLALVCFLIFINVSAKSDDSIKGGGGSPASWGVGRDDVLSSK